MATRWKSAATAIALVVLTIAATPVSAQQDGMGYGPQLYSDYDKEPPQSYDDGYAYAQGDECNPANYAPDQPLPSKCQPQIYCDQYGCPDNFYNTPIWYGPVFYNNVWFGGPVYFRNWRGRRQYWIQGAWRYDTWRGPHPSWWDASRYHTGPALGRNYYQRHGVNNQTNGVRVWRGAQGSTFYDNSGGRYFRPGSNYRQTMPPTGFVRSGGRFDGGGPRTTSSSGFHLPLPSQFHSSGAHVLVGAGSHRSGGGSHGHRR